MPILSVEDLQFHFHTREGCVRAVDGISYELEAGETLAIVGESGSGKSVSCMALLGLNPMPPGRVEGGAAHFDGRDLLRMDRRGLQKVRGKRIGMIFQDPMTALNPYMSIGAQLAEPLRIHENMSRPDAAARALAALREVGIPNPEDRIRAFPHQLSGGMRQRVVIAMALIAGPEIVIADEPTTALDVTVQDQILQLMSRLQERTGAAILFVTHDLGVVSKYCDRVAVMYAGRICESAPAGELFEQPRHPYTQALLDSLPATHSHGEALYSIPGQPPDLSEPIYGCPFAPRCAHVEPACRTEPIALHPIADNRTTACLRVQRGTL